MARLYIMSGLPFSGKSTLSRDIAKRLGIERISFDETWLDVEEKMGEIPGNDEVEKWKHVNKVCEERAVELLRRGESVVYDNLGSHYDHREKMRELASEAEATSRVVYVDVDKKEVRRRREGNLTTKDRAQVSDENFEKALKTFEPPRESEPTLAYKSSQNSKDWIDIELSQISGDLERE